MKKFNIDKLLMIFIIIQPLLDFYLLYSDKVIKVFMFSPSTIIRILGILFFTVYIIKNIKLKKEYKYILIYFILICIYMILHVFNSLGFNIGIINNLKFSYITEFFYYIRLLLPIILMYIVYKLDIYENTFRKAIIYTSLIFALQIIITNLLKISLTSYGGNNVISGSIISWFSNNSYTFEELASKGYFYMANQISAILIALLPINIYYAVKYGDKISIISSFLMALSMMSLGTRVASYGWLIVAIILLFVFIFFNIIKKYKSVLSNKKLNIYLILLIILLIIFLRAPLIIRTSQQDYAAMESINITNKIRNEYNNLKTLEEKENFIYKYHETFSIPYIYIKELYPYKNDINFWYNVIGLDYCDRGGNRNLENLITTRIYKLNNNKFDKYFGMGYSRFRNAKIYIEQDFVVHYYTIGLVGITLFIIPFLLIPTISIIYMLIKKRLKLETTILCISVYLYLGVSYFSGHALDELVCSLLVGFICGYILILTFTRNKKIVINNNIEYDPLNPSISVIIPVYNVEKYLKKCLNSVLNQSLKNIEVIAIDDGSSDSSSKILDEYKKRHSNLIIKHIENGGVSHARNLGMSIAKGKYIGFLDSDDYIDCNMYGLLYNVAINNKCDIVACDVNLVFENSIKIIKSGFNNSSYNEELKKKILVNSYSVIWNKIYKRSLISNIKFNEKSEYCEDVEFLFRVIPLCKKFGNINYPLYNYIQRPGSYIYTFDNKVYKLIINFDFLNMLYNKEKKYKKYLIEFEYSYVRYLFGTFIKRLIKTKNKDKYKEDVLMVINKVNTAFPNYRNNKYIMKHNLKSIYLKHFNLNFAKLMYKLKNK